MRLNQILTEQEQQEIEMLQEGPLGSLAKAAGRGIGNVIGGVARTAGAVKGAVKGAVDRAKSSFAGGQKDAYNTIAGKPDAAGSTTTPAAGGASKGAAGGGSTSTTSTTSTTTGGGGGGSGGSSTSTTTTTQKPGPQSKFNKLAGAAGLPTDGDQTQQPAGGGSTAQPKAGAGAAEPAAQDQKAAGAGAAEPAAQDQNAQGAKQEPKNMSSKKLNLVQNQIAMIPDAEKKNIIAMLQNDPDLKAAEQPAATTKPAAQPAATQAKTTAQPKAGSGRTQGGGRVAGQPLSQTPGAIKKREQRAKQAAATSTTGTVQQKQLTNKGFSQMLGGLTKQNASVERTGNVIKENFSFFRKK